MDEKRDLEQWLVKDMDGEYITVKANHWKLSNSGLEFCIDDERVAYFVRWASYRKLNV